MKVTLFGKHKGTTGPTRVTRGLAEGLATHGCDVTIIGYGDREDPPVPDVKVDLISNMPNSVRGWNKMFRKVRDRVSDTNCDIFHALERYPYYADVRTVQWTSDPYVLWRRTGEMPGFRVLAGDLILNWLSRKGAAAASVVVAQSPETERQMQRYWRLKSDYVIPLGINSSFLTRPTPPSFPIRIHVVGDIDKQKGQYQFLQSLDPDSPHYDVRIVGPISDKEYAEKALDGWEDKHIGYVSGDELESQYERADIIAIPSNLDSFSMVALESIAKGCVVVITDVCGFAQFNWSNEQNGIFVVEDQNKAAECVVKLSKDQPKLKELQFLAYKLAQSLTWERIANEYMQHYESEIEFHNNDK